MTQVVIRRQQSPSGTRGAPSIRGPKAVGPVGFRAREPWEGFLLMLAIFLKVDSLPQR